MELIEPETLLENKMGKKHKQSEFGLIPSDWNVMQFSDVMDGFSSGQTPYRAIADYYRGEIPWVTSGELNYNIITDTIEKITIAGVRAARLKIIPKGTFLFAITGLEAAGTRGSCAITGIETTTNQSCMALYPKKNLLTTPFLYQFYLRFGNKLAFEFCQGTKQQSFTGGIVRKLPIIVPPTITEQTAIATALSDADALINSLEKLIAKKRNIKQGAMQKLLQPKEGWEVKKLGEIGEIITGSTPPTQIKKYWNGAIPWITPTDISNNEKDIYHSEREISIDGLKVIRKLPSNTLLVTCIASIGKNAILRKNGSCNQQINAIIPYCAFDVDFLYYLIENNNQYLLGSAGITATLIISKKDFSEIIFSFPPKEEQTRIATILSDMDAEITALENKLEKYRNIKLGMMQNLLTGKIRLV
jgi:type I restriction enzyme S subunit